MICAAFAAWNDVMRAEIARGAAFAACAVTRDDESGELPPLAAVRTGSLDDTAGTSSPS